MVRLDLVLASTEADTQRALAQLNEGLSVPGAGPAPGSKLWGNLTRDLRRLGAGRVVASVELGAGGAAVLACPRGHKGPLCAQCEEHYVGGTEKPCTSCGGSTPWWHYLLYATAPGLFRVPLL